MKKFLICLLVLFLNVINASADENLYELVNNSSQVIYNPINASWSLNTDNNEGILLVKRASEGTGSYSQYLFTDNRIAFTLPTAVEIIKNGKLIAVDDDELKFTEIVYDGEVFLENPLSPEKIEELFPEFTVFRLSRVENDNKIWLHKPFGKNKKFIFINDTDRFFHKLSAKDKKVQTDNLRCFVNIYRYGIFNFIHYGKRNGKLTIYVR